VLFRHAQKLARGVDLDAVLEAAGQFVFDLLPRATHVGIALRESGGRFPTMYARNRAGVSVENAVSRTLLRRVVEERAALLLTNASTELASARSIVQAGLRSTLCIPLWTGDEVRGVLQVDNREAVGTFAAADLEVLTVAAQQLSLSADNARLLARLRHAEQRLEGENRFLKQREADATFAGIVGRSPGVEAVLRAVEKVRDTRVPVLIQGETGTGKELVARALHYTSTRRERLFVAQNCSALPEGLLESELFGHVKGAFTGADRDKKGLFELADGGTMFLDEVGEAPPAIQAKLLRVLQEGEIWPVGAPRPRSVDVRTVSATHRDLERMVRDGAFRQDLFYRLHVFPVRMPALRERREDVPLLARHFLERYAREFGRQISGFVPDALDRLAAYDWPGNVRELQNEIQRALINRTEGDLVLLEDLSPRVLGRSGLSESGDLPRGNLKDMMDTVERLLLTRALREHAQNKTRTAEALGITREGLHKKLARFGMHE
jgi:Nif-specific regulatory protein